MADLIPNNQRHSRQVIFDRNNQVTAIQTAKRNPPATTTYQIIDKLSEYKISTTFLDSNQNPIAINSIHKRNRGDYKIVHICAGTMALIFGDFETIVRHDYINPDTKPLEPRELEALLDLIPLPVKAYLLAMNTQGERFNLIPDGYGWDGKHSNSELIRANKVKNLLIGEYEWKGFDESLVETICSEALFTPAKHTTTDWHKAVQYNEGDPLFIGNVNPNTKVHVFAQTHEMSELLTVSLGNDENGYLIYTPDSRYSRYVIVSTAMLYRPDKGDYGVRVKLYERIDHEQSG